MGTPLNDPDTWKAPQWHSDHGDCIGEFQHLRKLAKAITRAVAHLKVRFEVPEAGLMYVSLWHGERCIAEIYSNEAAEGSASRKYGVFAYSDTPLEEEHYFDSDDGAISFLGNLS